MTATLASKPTENQSIIMIRWAWQFVCKTYWSAEWIIFLKSVYCLSGLGIVLVGAKLVRLTASGIFDWRDYTVFKKTLSMEQVNK